MARVMYVDNNEWLAVMHGVASHEDRSFLRAQCDNFIANISPRARSAMEQHINDSWNSYDVGALTRKVRSIKHQYDHLWTPNEIRPLTDIGAIQQAKGVMREYLLANPTLRKAFMQERIQGWDIPLNSVTGPAHDCMEYRKATDGIVRNEGGVWFSENHYDINESNAITLEEQEDILFTWEYALAVYQQGGDDPTSPENNSL